MPQIPMPGYSDDAIKELLSRLRDCHARSQFLVQELIREEERRKEPVSLLEEWKPSGQTTEAIVMTNSGLVKRTSQDHATACQQGLEQSGSGLSCNASKSGSNSTGSSGEMSTCEEIINIHSPRRSTGSSGRVDTLTQAVKSTLEANTHPVAAKQSSLYERIIYCSRTIVQHRFFEGLMGIIILANSILMGIETDMRITGTTAPWIVNMEHVFISIYILELVLRFAGNGKANFKDNWVLFDIGLVITGVTTTYFVPIFFTGENHSVMVLRAFRLLRFARALRMVKSLGVMWKLVLGILKSWNTMLSTLGLILLSLYIFACMGVELITQDPSLAELLGPETMYTMYGSVPFFMLTLLNFVTLDSVSQIYLPLVRAKPILMFYFTPLMLIVSISLMNLVTAVLVENAMELEKSAQAEKRQSLKTRVTELVPKLAKVFDSIDQNGDGTLTMHELLKLDGTTLPEEFHDILMSGSLEELFMMLDLDRSGEVEKDEFIEGVLSVLFADVPREILLVLKIVKVQLEKMSSFEEQLRSLQDQVKLDKIKL